MQSEVLIEKIKLQSQIGQIMLIYIKNKKRRGVVTVLNVLKRDRSGYLTIKKLLFTGIKTCYTFLLTANMHIIYLFIYITPIIAMK